jgi:glycosyltransferase involved in cell wall biosynthesis
VGAQTGLGAITAMTRPLRFCMITTFYPPHSFGGDAIFVQRLSNELARRGHQVDVIHCVDAYRFMAGEEPTKAADDHPNVTVHSLRSRFGYLSPLATQQTGFPIFKSARIRQILAKGFDVIHYHNISLVGGPAILSYGRAIKLYTMHEYWLVCPTHMLFRFNRAPCAERHCLTCTLSHKRPPQWWRYSTLLEDSIKHVDAFISPSRFSQRIHEQMGISVPTLHLPNFVPSLEGGAPDDQWQSSDSPYFLFVGRLEKLKGPQTLIPVFRRYPKARLLVAGAGAYERRLRQLAEGSPNIEFLGHQSHAQLQELYRQAAAVIVPSLCFEMFPLVIIEAFRQKTPVIARNRGGLPEIIDDSGGGVIYETDDELVAGMDRFLADPSWRRELGRRGHEAHERNWNADAHLQRYFGLIEQIAATRRQRHPSESPLPAST